MIIIKAAHGQHTLGYIKATFRPLLRANEDAYYLTVSVDNNKKEERERERNPSVQGHAVCCYPPPCVISTDQFD